MAGSGRTVSKRAAIAPATDEILAEFDRIFREKTSPRKGYVPVEIEKATVGSGPPRVATEQTFRRSAA